MTRCEPASASPADQGPTPALGWMRGEGRAGWGWRQLLFPAAFLIFMANPVIGVHAHCHGVAATTVGYAIVVAFCGCYLGAIRARWSGRFDLFRVLYVGTVLLFVVALPFAHQSAVAICTYIAILGICTGERWSLPAAAVLTLIALLLPALVGGWHQGIDPGDALSVALVSLAMWAFFGVLRANRELNEARAEVAGLAAENERNRIARDLHDLLGHSLTTITVKAGLARRLAESDPQRAAREIGEVEELARQALSDVRAAVANYRVVTLTGELAAGQEVLRAAGIDGVVLSPTDVVRPDLQELLGWVAREGITNVVRHARATRCSITLGAGSIEIVDDGIGGSAGAGRAGLVGLRERVAALGGTVEAGPAPGRGWRLAVSVPDGSGPARTADPSIDRAAATSQ